MDAELVAALGALFSGIGSIIGGVTALYLQRRRDEKTCDTRVQEIRASFEAGRESAARPG